MTPAEHAQRVNATLSAAGVPFHIHAHHASHTVAEAEATLPFPVDRLLKTIVFRVKRGAWFLVACRGHDRVDYRKLAPHCGTARANIIRPDPEEILRVLGMEYGGICPFSPDGLAHSIVDAGVAHTLPTVFCGIGRNDRTLEIAPADLIAVAKAHIAPVVHDS